MAVSDPIEIMVVGGVRCVHLGWRVVYVSARSKLDPTDPTSLPPKRTSYCALCSDRRLVWGGGVVGGWMMEDVECLQCRLIVSM